MSSPNDAMMFDQSHVIGAVVATVLFIIALVLFVFVRSRRGRRDVVLLVGLSDAGKTKMYCRLVTGGDVQTFTSQCENLSKNVSFSEDDDKSVHTVTLIDVPGADRVRKPRMHHWLRTTAAVNSVKGIIVVVDSATFTKQARDVAELIYDTLASAKAPVLIAANKSDLPMAKSGDLIFSMLAGELTLLHKSRKAALAMTDASGVGNSPIMHMRGNAFDWEKDAVNCSFVECSCINRADDAAGDNGDDRQLAAVRQWICAL